MAGGGVPLQYKGREHVWDRKVKQYAEGGSVDMAGGGIAKLLKGLKGTQEVLPAAQREANLAKMLEGSAVKDRLYHGTQGDVRSFIPSRKGVFVTPDPKFAEDFAKTASGQHGPNVMPVRVQVKKPFDYDNPSHMKAVREAANKRFPSNKGIKYELDAIAGVDDSGGMTNNWASMEHPDVQRLIRDLGYDAYYTSENGTKNLGIYDPRRIKSDIGNRGTYDTTKPDLNEAKGGAVHMADGGAAFGVFPQMKPRRAKQDREAAKNVPVDLARGFVSGVLGAPGDIESLARLPYELITGKDSPTFLPTSEDIEKRLPFRSEAPVSRLASGAGQLAGGFYLGPGSPLRAVGALPGAIKHGAQEFAKASAAAAPRLTVYHGSPHKFDKFDASKIGTGEGAQAYGHGLYLAESPDVAKSYQPRSPKFEEKLIGLYNKAQSSSNYPMMEVLEDAMLHQSPGEIIKKFTSAEDGYTGQHAKAAQDFAKWYSKNEPEVGGLYTVDLPDEKIAQMLDWDKPLREQPTKVREALTSIARGDDQVMRIFKELGPDAPANQAYAALTQQAVRDKKYAGMREGIPEAEAMPSLSYGQDAASRMLRQQGIPGIRYLDQDSRTAGKGTSNFVVFPGEEDALTILERKKAGGPVKMAGGGAMKEALKKLLKPTAAGDAPKGVEPIVVKEKPAKEAKPVDYSPKVLESTAARFAEKIAAANPKLSAEEVSKKALTQATKKLEWERTQKPALEKRYGALTKSSYAESNPVKQQNTPEVVRERMRKANEFLDQPTEPWTPPKPELQAFDRSSIKDALEGFPGVEQSRFPRDKPSRANIEHVEELYSDPANRALIEKQIKRGLPLGGETFYASLYPVKQAVLEAGMPPSKFDQWIHSLAPASARNSIMNEMAVGQFMRDMNARGIPLTEENVAREMALYKEKFGIGLPLMPIHRQGVANVLEGGQNLRDMNLANIPTNYKIPTYGTQKAGDFANSAVLDVHEAGGHTQGSRFHPYFNEQGGFGNTEYGAGEQGLLGIAKDLGIPGGMSQAGRWFGGGELTGLKSPRGDALDLLEKQVAYTLQQKGVQPNPANVRKEVLRQIETGEGDLLPWYRKEGMPDVRETGLQRAEGGEVHMAEGGKIGGLSTVNKLCGCHD